MPSESANDLEYTEANEVRPRKRRKMVKVEEKEGENLLKRLQKPKRSSAAHPDTEKEDDFLGPAIAPDGPAQDELAPDDNGNLTRPLTTTEHTLFIERFSTKEDISQREALILRKLKLAQQRKVAHTTEPNINASETALTPLSSDPPFQTNPDVLDALYSIVTTPFASSFLSRLHGTRSNIPPGLIAIDWESRPSWTNLMEDIREHYALAHPEREQPIDVEVAPITYSTLHGYQLPQIHDLLERSFWTGIDVSDSLDYLPERTTVVAMYKKVVIGIAIIMSPIQTYITYLAVKAGWDKAQIARTMLFHLISMHPDKDFTLHVSTNSSAMLLYNQFGFKAEEFVIDFYSNYLDSSSRASKNAFKLRLRHLE